MGLCSSAQATSDPPPQKQTKYQQETEKKNEPVDADQILLLPTETDDDFRAVVKQVLCLILNRLSLALEYEGWAYDKVAQSMGVQTYLDIMLYSEWKELLSGLFQVEEPTATAEDDDSTFDQKHAARRAFVAFLSSLKDLQSPKSKKELVDSIQPLLARTQKELLRASDHCDASDLKMHCTFYANSMKILQGIEESGALYTKIVNFSRGGTS